MSRINPYFELGGNRYEIKRTRWLIAEYRRLNEENPISDADKANAIKASNLIADVKRYSEKEKECWDALCENPTEENQRVYFIFKNMNDNAIALYNEFVATNNTLQNATKHNVDILEKIAIKGLAEQYFGRNENLAKQTWESFVDTIENHNTVAEWLNAMGQCLFVEEDEVDDGDFLSQMRKKNREAEDNRKNGLRKKR
jgi:hypothetical protein